MKVLAAVFILTAVWWGLAAVVGCRGRRSAAARPPASGDIFTGEFWMWEERDGAVRLRPDAAPPARPASPRPVARTASRA